MSRDVEAEAETEVVEAEVVEAVNFFRKRKHFEERSWKRKQTRKRLTLHGAKIFYCFHIPGLKAGCSAFQCRL